MKRMDDGEHFATVAGNPGFVVGRLDSRVDPSCTSVRSFQVASPLDKVTDPELRDIMGIILEEDADLITYLRDR